MGKIFAVACLICSMAVAQAQNPFKGVKLSDAVNSNADELAPLVSPDGKWLYFVRASHEDNVGGEEEGGHDIWIAKKLRTGKWAPAVNMGAPVNNTAHNGVGGLSANGKTVYVSNIYNSFGNSIAPGISSAFASGSGWLAPKTVYEAKNIAKTRSFGFYVLPGGEAIILSMATEASPENEDLYVITKEGNGWSEPIGLGSQVNTDGYEIAPFLSADGKRLFFASSGHKGQGNADIFYADRLGDSWTDWSAPVNLGPEVNTAGFEAYFSIDTVAKRGYFVSDLGAEYGDIYSIPLENIPALKAKPEEVLAKEEPKKEPVEEAVVKEEPKEQPVVVIDTSKEQPDVVVQQPKEEPVVVIQKPKEALEKEPKETAVTVIPEGNSKAAFAYIYFAFNEYLLNNDAKQKVRAVVDYLAANPDATVKLDGHADHVGADSVNHIFGEARCESIRNYMLAKGINPARINIASFGEQKPAAPNETPDGRKQNRRVEVFLMKD